MMLSIPLPLLITSQLPRAKYVNLSHRAIKLQSNISSFLFRKLILCCLFGLGIFVVCSLPLPSLLFVLHNL
jgi:hypothetical protein